MNKTMCPLVWVDGEMRSYKEAFISPATHSLHYGTSVYEGIRFYNTEKGPALFRLGDHLRRLEHSAKAMEMALPFSEDTLTKAVCGLVRASGYEEGYVRPIVFLGEGLGLTEEVETHVAIMVLPWGKTSETPLALKTVKVNKVQTPERAKVGGAYFQSYYECRRAKAEGFDDVLFVTTPHRLVTETSVGNFFCVRVGGLVYPENPLIFPGITRGTILDLARVLEIPVYQEKLYATLMGGWFEVFITGTAREVTAIEKIDHTVFDVHKTTLRLKSLYTRVVHGQEPEFVSWLTYV